MISIAALIPVFLALQASALVIPAANLDLGVCTLSVIYGEQLLIFISS
jgi:hypothetical protein